MCKRLFRLGTILALCLALTATAGLGEAADVVASPVDVPAQGALDFEPVPEAVPLAAIPAQEVIIPHDGVAKSIRKYAETSEEKAAANAASYRVVAFGETFDLGGAEFLVLGPVEVRHVSDSSTKENDNSLILRVTYGANTFLLTGDATKKEFIATETARPGCLRAQVYKNPHHYARIEYAFRHCMPQIVVFSTDNAHQPAARYLTVIQNAGSQVYITSNNRNGHVTIVSDGANLSVSTQY